MTNPERLWVTCASDGVAVEARGYDNEPDAQGYRESLLSCEGAAAFSPVAEYVLASVASNEACELRNQRNVLASKLATAEDEAAALRAEVEALRVVARRAGEVLEWVAMWVPDGAYDDLGAKLVPALNEAIDKAELAAKGVG